MAETMVFFTLNRLQRTQFFAHLFVFLLTLDRHPITPQSKADLEMAHEVTSRLRQACEDEREDMVVTLSLHECRIITGVLLRLTSVYEQAVSTETGMMALRDLSACLDMVGEAEQHTIDTDERA